MTNRLHVGSIAYWLVFNHLLISLIRVFTQIPFNIIFGQFIKLLFVFTLITGIKVQMISFGTIIYSALQTFSIDSSLWSVMEVVCEEPLLWVEFFLLQMRVERFAEVIKNIFHISNSSILDLTGLLIGILQTKRSHN